MKISMKEVKEKGNGKERKKVENEKGRQRMNQSWSNHQSTIALFSSTQM
jgi:hypothetical protein